MTPTDFDIWWAQFSQYAKTTYFAVTTIIALVVSAAGVLMEETEDLP